MSALPPAIRETPRQVNPDSSSPAPSLPSDSDQAALDAIAASGKPLTLPEAIEMAFRYQPRLPPSSKPSARHEGSSRLPFPRSCPLSPATTTSVDFPLE